VSDVVVVDANERRLKVGARVCVGSDEPDATIVTITEPDGDYSPSLERVVGIDPKVGVRYDGDEELDEHGVSEWWPTSSSARGPNDDAEPYICDDVRVP
jgi:hypothetical protein